MHLHGDLSLRYDYTYWECKRFTFISSTCDEDTKNSDHPTHPEYTFTDPTTNHPQKMSTQNMNSGYLSLSKKYDPNPFGLEPKSFNI